MSDSVYQEKVKKPSCFIGIKTHTALSCIVETGDFDRLKKGNQFAAYLALVPGEHSSGEHTHKPGITKTGNVAVTAVARELACFIWGMMTGNIETDRTNRGKKIQAVIG